MKKKSPNRNKRRAYGNRHSQGMRISDLKQKNVIEDTRTEQTDVIIGLSLPPNAINCALEATSWRNATSRPGSTNRISRVTCAKEQQLWVHNLTAFPLWRIWNHELLRSIKLHNAYKWLGKIFYLKEMGKLLLIFLQFSGLAVQPDRCIRQWMTCINGYLWEAIDRSKFVCGMKRWGLM